jgi:hypothetical protein
MVTRSGAALFMGALVQAHTCVKTGHTISQKAVCGTGEAPGCGYGLLCPFQATPFRQCGKCETFPQ